MQRAVPKFGFKNINRVEYKAINLDALQKLAEEKNLSAVDVQTFIDAGLADKNDRIKILGNGELKLKLEVKAHAFSKSAKAAIEKLEGTIETL
ncbi:50S ribosomal protein L15 [Sunxiuqinia dokdonensis]|uniref:50S ribosomal protein L15 n=1 Tax=Sunxiuqinia dokdonensis TaxID=1409788 RepID=A0A0L8V3Q1_9BACT|nr:50S ribosomal protein L15 [Sunxiuqinia dokdonensis]